MTPSRSAKLGIIALGLALAAIIYFFFDSDAFRRRAMVGHWRCDPFFAETAQHFTFLRVGSYARFDSASSNAVDHGTWDVLDGRLVLINNKGGSTSAALEVSPWGSIYELDQGAARCRERRK